MFANLTGWHFLIILAIILLIFGATKLPALARSLGQSAKIIKHELNTSDTKTDAERVAREEAAADTAVATARSDSSPSSDIHAKL